MKRSGMKAKYSPTEKAMVSRVEFVAMPQQLLVRASSLRKAGQLRRSPSPNYTRVPSLPAEVRTV